MQDNGHRAAYGIFVPYPILTEHFFDAAIRIVQFGFEFVPYCRGHLFNSSPDLAPVCGSGVVVDDIAFEHFKIKRDVCDLRGERGALASNGNGGLLSGNSLEGPKERRVLIQINADEHRYHDDSLIDSVTESSK